jgi:hypothetical protein
MATKQPAAKTRKQPAKGEAKQPATKQPAVKQGVGIKEMASDLGRSEKSVRGSIRRLRGGAQVGQGGRYSWPSRKDSDYVEIVKALTSSNKEDETEKASA